jgi:hypothetical protein
MCRGADAGQAQQLVATGVFVYSTTDFAAVVTRDHQFLDNRGSARYIRVRHTLTPRARLLMVLAT